MKKNLLFVFFSALLALSSFVFAEGFGTVRSYEEGTFSDVADDAWYATEVKASYELGFMQGAGEGYFLPDGNVTVAEALTMASRLHAAYFAKAIPAAGEPWYAVYVNFAVENGIIDADTFGSSDYERNIRRAEMAEVFYKALPAEWFVPVNEVDGIPDVSASSPHYPVLLALYKSGVVMGNDEYGTFSPDADILRCEAAAIINRIALPDHRLQRMLAGRADPVPALYFVDDNGVMYNTNAGRYGWEYDTRGIPVNTAAGQINVLDVSKTETTAMFRSFARQTDGRLVMESRIRFDAAKDGFHMILSDGYQGKAAMDFVTKDNRFFARVGDTLIDTGASVAKNLYVKTVTDLDKGTNSLYLEGLLIGMYALADSDIGGVDTLVFSGSKETTTVASPYQTKLYSGYAFNDVFLSIADRTLGDAWTVEGVTAKTTAVKASAEDSHSAVAAVNGNGGVISAGFLPIGRKVCFEMKFYLPQEVDGLTIALTSGGNDVIKMVTNGGAFYTGDGVLVKDYDERVWQTVRFEANTDSGVVDYALDHKRFIRGRFAAKTFDGIRIVLPAGNYDFTFDDVFVFNLFDEQPDYVPVPQKVVSADGYVGMEACDIWRNGYQYGWDYTSPFEELTPYLGYYDEGSTEVADWEIKWLAEHGVNFELVCWYNGTVSGPLKTPRHASGLHAKLDAKYTDMMQYAIMWENDQYMSPDSDHFRNCIVPFWKEYYLSDRDRYFAIDNKALVTFYRATRLVEAFGSAEAAKAELDYLRSEIKSLGYDDAIFLAYGTTAFDATLKAMGFDGVMAYGWGTKGYDPDYHIDGLRRQDALAGEQGLTSVPTVGVGFCNMYLAQSKGRYPNITNDDFRTVINWVRNDLLAGRSGEDWQTKLVMFSNWNEFGEGHYIMPAERNGFGYLDVIRELFVGEGAHEDVRPTQAQKVRFNGLFNQDFKRIRELELVDRQDAGDVSGLAKALSYDFTDPDVEHNYRSNHGNEYAEYDGGTFHGKSSGGDFAIVNNDNYAFNAKKTRYLRFIMSTKADTEKNETQIFFSTDSDPSMDNQKYISIDNISDGEFHEYVVDMSQNANWRGTILKVRIDPIHSGNCEWAFKLIEFLDVDEDAGYELYINDSKEEVPVLYGPHKVNGGLVAAIDPNASAFYSKLGIFFRWDSKAQIFTVYGAEDSYIEYRMGSSSANSSEGTLILCAPAELYDGVPYIDLDAMCRALGLDMSVTGEQYRISHHYLGESAAASPDIEWNFDIPGYMDGFDTACLTQVDHEDGAVVFETYAESNGRYDARMNSPLTSFSANRYGKIVVRMAYELAEQQSGISPILFFHGSGGSFNDKQLVRVDIPGSSTNGEFIDVEFDMTSNPRWTGEITQIRFDPFEAPGIVKIDSIRIILTDPDAENDDGSITALTMTAGEDEPNGVYTAGENAKISVVTDPENDGKKVYEVLTTAARHNWTYFNVFMKFKAGKTYRATYKIYPLKDYSGNAFNNTAIGGNFMFGTDGQNVSNHTVGIEQYTTGGGWREMTAEFAIPAGYKPCAKDCFQFWSSPCNDLGTSYLVSDISIICVDE